MKKICPVCNGTGQASSFKGVSRFLLSWEECEQCSGLGYLLEADDESRRRPGSRSRQPPGEEDKGGEPEPPAPVQNTVKQS